MLHHACKPATPSRIVVHVLPDLLQGEARLADELRQLGHVFGSRGRVSVRAYVSSEQDCAFFFLL